MNTDKYSRFTLYVLKEDKLVYEFIKSQSSFTASMRLLIWVVASKLKKMKAEDTEILGMDMFSLIDLTDLKDLDLSDVMEYFSHRRAPKKLNKKTVNINPEDVLDSEEDDEEIEIESAYDPEAERIKREAAEAEKLKAEAEKDVTDTQSDDDSEEERLKAEAEAKKKAEEAEAARLKAEAEAKAKEEAEAKKKAEEEAEAERLKAEAEAKAREEAEAKKKAEEEAAQNDNSDNGDQTGAEEGSTVPENSDAKPEVGSGGPMTFPPVGYKGTPGMTEADINRNNITPEVGNQNKVDDSLDGVMVTTTDVSKPGSKYDIPDGVVLRERETGGVDPHTIF